MPKIKPTVPEVLRQYQEAQKFETDTEFAEAFGVTKQRLSQWFNGIHDPEVDYLKVSALLHIALAPWKAQMAIDLLKAMGKEEDIPCSCWEYIPDNEHCPKHYELYKKYKKAEVVS